MRSFTFRRAAALLLTVTIMILSGCSIDSTPMSERTAFLFDTIISIKLRFDDEAEDILNGAIQLCEHYDRLFDLHDPSSDAGRINASKGQPCTVDTATAEVISIALEYAELSNGRFDITCGRLTELWDFGADPPVVPEQENIESALETIGWQQVFVDGCTVRIPENCRIDLGGIAKGYITDKVIEYLRECGVDEAIVNLGGNVRVLGDKNGQLYSVGIQSPFDENGYAGILSLSDCSVVTAGSYQRCFELDGSRYHHILDLSSGMPADTGLASVSVISESSAQADALSTTCFLMGADDGIKLIESLEGVEAVFITTDGQTLLTSGASKLFRTA